MEKKDNSYLWPTSQVAGAAPPTMTNHHVPQDRRVSVGVESSGAYSALSGVTATSGQLYGGNDSTSIQALHTSGLGTHEKLAEVRRGVGRQSSVFSKGRRGVTQSPVPGSFSSFPSVPSAYGASDKKMSFQSASSLPQRRSMVRSQAARTRHHGLASFIWGGQASQDTCVKMLDRVRQQFREPQWHGHDPLILPPQIPSASRPSHQEIPKFSRAIQLLRGGLQEYNKRKQSGLKVRERGESQGIRSEENWSSRDEEILFSASLGSSSPFMAHQRANSKGDSQSSKPERTRSVRSAGSDAAYTLPSAAQRMEEELAAGWSAGKSAFVSMGEKEVLGGFPPHGRSISSVKIPPTRRESSDASLPIWELNSMPSKHQRLQQMEVLERRRVERTEMWDRQVVKETMVVHYVTSVLKQQMEEIKDKERAIRMMIRYEEEKDFYYLYNDSPIAQTISKEWKALREKEMKLARIKEREMLYAMEKDVQMPSKEKAFPKKELSDGMGIGSLALATEGKTVGRANFSPMVDEAEGDEGPKRCGVTGGTSGGGIVSRTKSVLLSYFNAAKPSKENQPSLSSSSSAGHAASITAGTTGLDGGGGTALPPKNGEGEKKVTPRAGGGAALRLGHAGRPRGGPRFPGIFSSSTTHPLSGSDTGEESGGVGDGPLLPKVTKVDPAQLLPAEVADVRLLVYQYVQQKTCQVVEGGRNKSNAFILPPSTENASTRGPTTRKGGPSAPACACASSPEMRRVSALILPPIQSTTNSRRTVVGVADYITLLDEDDQYRALIEISEKEERRDIQRLMREDWRTVMDWQRKCMHLNRLVYWRDQREAHLREEVERLTRTVGQEISAAVQQGLESIRTEEAMEREEMHRQEMEGRLEQMLLLRLELEKDQRVFFTNHVSHDKDCLLQWYYTGYRTIMLAEERHARSLLEVEERTALEREIVQQAHVLHLLQEVECHPQGVAAVETIQKAYHRYRRGVLGYRRTHRVVGREIQAKRTEKKVAEGLEVFETYKRELYAEMHAVHQEEREKFGLQVERLVSMEFSDRLALTSYEGMGWTTLQRSFLRVLREDIIGGEIRKEVIRESEERMELGVKAELGGEAIFSFAHRCRRLIHKKEMLVFEEGKARKACSAEEADLRHLLAGDEGRAREEIRLEEVTQLAKKAAAIAAIAMTFTTEWETLATSALTTHASFLLQLHKKAITKLAFEERFYQHLLYQETIPAVWKTYVEWMTEDHRILTTVQWNEFRQFHQRAQRKFEEEVEAKERTSLGNEEAVTFHALRQAYLTMVNEKKSLENEKDRAVRLLCRVWRQYCNHELGRSGTRRFLQETFREKREAHFIASRKAEQKKLLASVRRELEKEERSIRRASAARLQCSLEEIEYQEEPKKRWEIQEEEEMIFHILRSNCFSFQTGRFDNRNQFAMLWQHESYERVLLQRQWWRGFEKVFYPKKSVIREEVSVIQIQRTWRAYQKRMAQLARRIAAEKELFHAETSDRLFTMEREAVYYMELYHEILTKEFEASVLFSLRPQMEVKEAHERCVATILREEWTARCEILWDMRYDEADGWFMSVEQRERKALTETQLRPLLEIAAFMEEETVIRQLLQRERVNFLFRMILRVEALQRHTITKAYPQVVVQEWLPQQESLHRQVLVSDSIAHFWRDTIYLPLATAMKKEIDMEERPVVSRLVVFLEEWDGRRAVHQLEVAARRGVVSRMEWMDRGALQTEEQFAREGSLRLTAKEHEKRIQLIGEWAVGLQYVPSSFAPHHVYVPTSLFERGIKEAETLVRAYLQRSEETSWDAVVEVVRGVLEESGQRLALEEEEKYTRERRMWQVMECEARNALIHDWAVGLQYVPSSFAPTVVNQPLYVFADGIAQTEAHSRDYITLAAEEERKAIRCSYRLMHEEHQSRTWVEHQEGVTRAILLDCDFEEKRHRFLLRREYFIAVRYAPSTFAPSMVYSRISVFVQFVLEEEEILRRQLNDAEWQDRQRIQRNKRDDTRRKEEAVTRAKEVQKLEVIAAERAHRNEIVENAMVVFPLGRTMLCRVPTPPLSAPPTNARATPRNTGEMAFLPHPVHPPPSAPPQSGTPSSSLPMPHGGENVSLPPLPSSSPLPAGRMTVQVDAPPLGEREPPRSEKEDTNGTSLPSLPPAHPERKMGASVDEALEPSMPSPLPPLVIQNERYVYFVEALESLERKSRKFISRRCIKAYLTLWETAFQERGLPLEEKKWVDGLARAFYVEELNAISVEDEESEDYWDVGDNRLDTLMLMRRDHDDEDKKDGEDNVSPSSAPEFYFQRRV